MPLLFCAATRKELQAAFPFLEKISDFELSRGILFGEWLYMVTGVGTPATLLSLLPLLLRTELSGVVQLGLAGAYPGCGLVPGNSVFVKREVVADLGAVVEGDFFSLDKLGLSEQGSWSATPCADFPHVAAKGWTELPEVGGATVNCCTGSEAEGQGRSTRCGALVESMEGAAAFMACQIKNLPVLQLRTISNFATLRSEAQWNIDGALVELNRLFEHLN